MREYVHSDDHPPSGFVNEGVKPDSVGEGDERERVEGLGCSEKEESDADVLPRSEVSEGVGFPSGLVHEN
ncbi:MAG: hypothetical protein ACK56F_28235 [bacterium]